MSTLATACLFNNLTMAKFLLTKGADPNSRVSLWQDNIRVLKTPLELATRHEDPKIVRLLLSKGSDPGTLGVPGIISLASDLKRMDIVKLLQDHYAEKLV